MKKIKDHYFHKAKRDGYVARSAYKLEEIDKKHRLLRKGNLVLDLGCSPGSWLQYAAGKVGGQGQVLGVDLQTVKLSLPKNVKVLQADIFKMKVKDLEMNGGMVDVILSDMAPKTTGIRNTDAQRSYALNQQVLELSGDLLRPHGTLMVKAFQGAPLEQLRREFSSSFAQVKLCKPKSSRSESVEIFLLGLNKK
ncbi:MAG: RlmE family RNA methyltransferase [SAR324 cluster bacterium]|nr:RlmE family RNA methyltransferase [SAR324 cluster bacterium]MDP6295204.1 RlmE family RNA methyltransferase [SAR324 cluster bacterium]MDP6656593.1 RlmE family RNA methyltransferase [SAR324 cluster bacterium]MDP6743691.1 RlmE family RNA methyltransferase [SAR324 cluster bacterium]MEC8941072.1 RlmE family RNA methyltransferase [SAR324 cluster bacterium]